MAIYDPPQPLWKRIFAGIFDFILAAMVFAVMLYQFFGEYKSDQTGSRYELNGWGLLALVVLIAAYFVVLGRTGGTVFQRVLGMKRAKAGATQANEYGYAPAGSPVSSSGRAQNVAPTGAVLTATFQGASVVVDSARPLLRVGRGRNNDLVVSDRFASGKHARIECRGEQFFLIDQSSNGTYVSIQGMHEMQVAGREIVLHGSGLIGLGRSPATEPEFGIRFAIQMPP